MKNIRKIQVNFFIIIFLMFFISAGAAPSKHKSTMKKDIKSEYGYKKSSCKCPPMKSYKKITGYNKNLNKSRRAV
jgi:hypothetical protein